VVRGVGFREEGQGLVFRGYRFLGYGIGKGIGYRVQGIGKG
jgi:hypothetical protein